MLLCGGLGGEDEMLWVMRGLCGKAVVVVVVMVWWIMVESVSLANVVQGLPVVVVGVVG